MLYSGSESIRWPNKKLSTKSCPFYRHFEVQIQVEHGPSNMPVANGSTLYQINITNTYILDPSEYQSCLESLFFLVHYSYIWRNTIAYLSAQKSGYIPF